jgi:hypothetical protein
MPVNVSASAPWTPSSPSVGTSGRSGERLRVVISNAFMRPSRMCEMEAVSWSIMPFTWLPRTSVIAGPLPLYGTCRASTPAADFSISEARCTIVPLPEEP